MEMVVEWKMRRWGGGPFLRRAMRKQVYWLRLSRSEVQDAGWECFGSNDLEGLCYNGRHGEDASFSLFLLRWEQEIGKEASLS